MPYKDLSTVHSLVSDIINHPPTREEWEQYKLSDEQVDFFNEQGYLANIKMLDEKQVAIIKAEIEELADSKHLANKHSHEASMGRRVRAAAMLVSVKA